MIKLKSISQIKDLKNKKVLLRTDFNVPIKNGRILDDERIRASLETINYLIKKRAKIIILSHLGRPLEKSHPTGGHPKGEKTQIKNKKYSLKLVAVKLEKLLKKKVIFIDDCLRPKINLAIEKMKPGEVIILENLRFYPEEGENNSKFAKKLASLADVYINEAFSVCHREHASVSAITKYLSSYAGFLLEKEIVNLTQVLKPKHPAIAILGGAKISTKIGVIKNLLKKFDKILIGGAIANNFLREKGYKIGQSTVEKDYKLKFSKEEWEKIIIPIDVVIKKSHPTGGHPKGEKTQIKNLKINQLNKLKDNNFKILDIGPGSVKVFSKYIKKAKLIVWNGPMGLFEEKPFDWATRELSKVIFKNRKARIIIGGGETIASLKIKNLSSTMIGDKKFYPTGSRPQGEKIKNNVFISTGGGAMLEFLEGKVLPGIRPLMTSS